MNQPYLISGSTPDPASYPPRPRSFGPARLIKLVITVWVLAGVGYLIFRLQTRPSAAPASVISAEPVTAMSTEDLAHHMEAVYGRIADATTRLQHAEGLINRTLPSVERNYLLVDKKHLETALAAAEAARHDLEQSRQDADLILNSLKEKELK